MNSINLEFNIQPVHYNYPGLMRSITGNDRVSARDLYESNIPLAQGIAQIVFSGAAMPTRIPTPIRISSLTGNDRVSTRDSYRSNVPPTQSLAQLRNEILFDTITRTPTTRTPTTRTPITRTPTTRTPTTRTTRQNHQYLSGRNLVSTYYNDPDNSTDFDDSESVVDLDDSDEFKYSQVYCSGCNYTLESIDYVKFSCGHCYHEHCGIIKHTRRREQTKCLTCTLDRKHEQ